MKTRTELRQEAVEQRYESEQRASAIIERADLRHKLRADCYTYTPPPGEWRQTESGGYYRPGVEGSAAAQDTPAHVRPFPNGYRVTRGARVVRLLGSTGSLIHGVALVLEADREQEQGEKPRQHTEWLDSRAHGGLRHRHFNDTLIVIKRAKHGRYYAEGMGVGFAPGFYNDINACQSNADRWAARGFKSPSK